MGTGFIYSLRNTSQNEKVTQFFKSLQYKKMSSSPGRFWETANEKEITTDTTALKQSGWYANAINAINAKEYEINYDRQLKSYTSPNRKNDLRALYTNNTFTLSPRNDSADKWKLELALQGIYSGKQKIYSLDANASVTRSGQAIRFNHNNDFIVEYINNEEGVRQNFIIQKAPASQPKKINIKLKANGNWFVNKVNDTEIHFARAKKDGYDKKITYNGLKVWDAENKKLDASFTVNNNEIGIEVQTQNAVYPVTIDPISTSVNMVIESNQANAQMGWSATSAGDVNGDGYSDVIVGAPGYDDGQSNEGKVFVYHGSATGLSATAAWTAQSDQVSAQMGWNVNTAGDVNGDGYSDVIIGAPFYDAPSTNEGRAYVYLGSATGLAASPVWTGESNQANAEYGGSVASAGDVNGDGYSDVIAGAPYYDGGQTDEGRAYVYHGSSTGPAATAAWTAESNQAFAYFGGTLNTFVGTGVASAGDINGDSYSDIIIAAPLYDNGESDEGRAFLYIGSSSGLAVSSSWTAEGNQATAYFGNSLASAGDVNGDGYSDVIVGAYGYDNPDVNEGAAYVYHGSSGGLAASASWSAEINLAGVIFGCGVASAGDVNGDGYSDVIIGASGYDNGQTDEGGAFAYFGSATGLPATAGWTGESNVATAFIGAAVSPAGDVNGDGYSDVIISGPNYGNGQGQEGAAYIYHGSASGISTTVAAQVESNQAAAGLGGSVACAGDVNGDGYTDIIVGAKFYDNGETDEGVAFVCHGSATGINTVAATVLQINQAAAYFGWSVACAGDVNGDGYSDVIVGALSYDNGQSNEGAVFIYHGSATGINNIASATVEGNQVNAWMGFSVAAAGDVNGDGYSDVIAGAYQYNNGQAAEGAAFVYHGSATGINTIPATMLESNQASAGMGVSVASAGDVNGDGYADVIVGAVQYGIGGGFFVYHGSITGVSNTAAGMTQSSQAVSFMGVSVSSAGDVNGDGYSDIIVGACLYDGGEGVAFVYHGSATGINMTPVVTLESNQVNSEMGHSVASAGDINGDGYSDVIVGAYSYDNGQTDEGAFFIYHGSTTGINNTATAMIESNQAGAQLGYYVASAGDLNGDGYSDVIASALNFDNGQTDEGALFVHQGNNGTGQRNNLRLYDTDLTTPIRRNNFNVPNLFGAGLYAKSPLGRVKGKLVWEVKAQGLPFSGNPITNSTAFLAKQPSLTDLGIAGTELKYNVAKQGRHNKIRARVEYDKATAITGQVYGPWRYPPGYTQGAYGMNATPLPLTLISFNGQFVNKDDVQLHWTTANEINMQQFIVERSEDGINFSALGALPAKGVGAGSADYSYMDRNVRADLLYYRLKLKEQNGAISYSHIIPLSRIKKANGYIAPNPVTRNTDAKLTIRSSADNTVHIRVFNSSGHVMLEKNALLHNGSNEIRIATNGLSKGMYVVSVLGKNINGRYNLIVQ